jgi:hypothetical protein
MLARHEEIRRGSHRHVRDLYGARAFAQEIDFSGQWAPIYHEDGPERLPGPELGDYLGLPINDAARLRADSYDADRISAVSEYQCRQHAADYGMRGLANMRITAEIDPMKQRIFAFHTRIGFHDAERTIYLDDRAHPPATAPHTWAGFSTGVYEGNMLTIKTTHLKAYYIRRNGVPASDRRTMTEHWVRHGDFLTVVTVIDDPVFLTERLVRSQSWALDPGQTMGSNWCEYAAELPLGDEAVPHYLPGTNPYLKEFSTGTELLTTRRVVAPRRCIPSTDRSCRRRGRRSIGVAATVSASMPRADAR